MFASLPVHASASESRGRVVWKVAAAEAHAKYDLVGRLVCHGLAPVSRLRLKPTKPTERILRRESQYETSVLPHRSGLCRIVKYCLVRLEAKSERNTSLFFSALT